MDKTASAINLVLLQSTNYLKQARIQGGGLGVVPPLLSTTNFFYQQTF